jgi:hypothetical protein
MFNDDATHPRTSSSATDELALSLVASFRNSNRSPTTRAKRRFQHFVTSLRFEIHIPRRRHPSSSPSSAASFATSSPLARAPSTLDARAFAVDAALGIVGDAARARDAVDVARARPESPSDAATQRSVPRQTATREWTTTATATTRSRRDDANRTRACARSITSCAASG